jgi:cytochrome c
MSDQFNTFAGWGLFAGVVALGGTLLAGEYFKHHEVGQKDGGYYVAPVEDEAGGPVEVDAPIGQRMAQADVASGETTFKKCVSCHTIAAGGANGLGPNLHAILGAKHGRSAGFAYSAELIAKPGNWDFANMDAWLKKPKAYVAGTKMGFAGISKAQERANLIAYLNAQGSNLPMPPVEAAGAAPAADAKAGAVPAADAKAADTKAEAKPADAAANAAAPAAASKK